LAHVDYRKFATGITGWCMVRPPNTVYVTTLPCETLNHNFTDVLHIYYH